MFRVIEEHEQGRLGALDLGHGQVKTPVYMPVATRGAIRVAPLEQVNQIGFNLILNNTYHLVLRPGLDVLEQLGGTHRFMAWNHNVLTDSGGFQIFSLKKSRKIRHDGIEFKSPIDGSTYFFTPEFVAHAQNVIGSDIAMQLDICLGYPASTEEAKKAMDITLRWGERFLKADRIEGQKRFGIVQGGFNTQLRKESARLTAMQPFDGFAIGGLSVGEPEEMMFDLTAEVLSNLPKGAPKYMMGVGDPFQIVVLSSMGIDMFDCVQPTRHARHGWVYSWDDGPQIIVRGKHKFDHRPLQYQPQYTYSYLHHLFKAGEPMGMLIATVENLSYMADLVGKLRNAIASDTVDSLKEEIRLQWRKRIISE
ncbi:tRNA guanosine(34) transglycosylase Tgt [Coprothermobacter platensis]|uniref:tRNA guanosine(34) transglycosylase Tgt n=1 Tax=Coprothermobacter platensis TaxID=108819 RepID=UPI00035D9C78|nr:tRNA guanosine(34) transglycosylase Tgt [Coprothermobacter platensis]